MFPLYDLFKRQVSTEPLTNEQKKTLIKDIGRLDKTGKDNLYMLIRHSASVNKNESIYNAKYQQKKGVVFDLESLPDELQQIVKAFVSKHIEETSNVEPVEIVFE